MGTPPADALATVVLVAVPSVVLGALIDGGGPVGALVDPVLTGGGRVATVVVAVDVAGVLLVVEDVADVLAAGLK